MKQEAEGQPLSVHRAFVVQFRAETDVAGGRLEGRVEHVTSGQATHFHSLEELLAFIGRVLSEVSAERDAHIGYQMKTAHLSDASD